MDCELILHASTLRAYTLCRAALALTFAPVGARLSQSALEGFLFFSPSSTRSSGIFVQHAERFCLGPVLGHRKVINRVLSRIFII